MSSKYIGLVAGGFLVCLSRVRARLNRSYNLTIDALNRLTTVRSAGVVKSGLGKREMTTGSLTSDLRHSYTI